MSAQQGEGGLPVLEKERWGESGIGPGQKMDMQILV